MGGGNAGKGVEELESGNVEGIYLRDLPRYFRVLSSQKIVIFFFTISFITTTTTPTQNDLLNHIPPSHLSPRHPHPGENHIHRSPLHPRRNSKRIWLAPMCPPRVRQADPPPRLPQFTSSWLTPKLQRSVCGTAIAPRAPRKRYMRPMKRNG